MGYAFISYSTKNQVSADAMYMLLKKNELSAWMAPGDIPAGYKYADVINKAIKDCSCVILLLSNASLNSVWVPKEVERAVNYRKPIIPVQLEDVILNDEFEMYISTDQVVAVQRFDESSDAVTKLLTSLKTYISGNQPPCAPATEIDNPNTAEKTFDQHFNAVFENNSGTISEPESRSPMAKKLKERKQCIAIRNYTSWINMWDDAETAVSNSAAENNMSYKHSLIDIKNGIHFTLPVDKRFVTVIYEVFCSWSYINKAKYYFLEKIDSVETIAADGSKYITFFIDKPVKKGNAIILLHLNKFEEHVLINSGMLIDDEIIIGNQPDIFEFKSIEVAKMHHEDTFCLDNLSDEEKKDYLHGVSSIGEYSIDPGSTIITIDTETYQPVPKEIYFEGGEYKAKIKLKSGRNYFSFQICEESDNCSLTKFDIAECYLYGRGGFPKDVIKAAELFEEIGDADSLYQLAHIWFDESHGDIESLQDGIFYLEEAAQQGHGIAKAELVYYLMKLLCMLPADEQKSVIDKYHEQIKCAVDTELPSALFLAAYMYEKGLFVERDIDLAFTFYLRAAQADNDAARARINLTPVGSCQSEDECRSNFINSTDTIGLADYFMGWFLADDPDVMVVTEDILHFYELAANNGVMPAIRELVEVYISGNSYIEADPVKAIMWCEKLTDIDDDMAVKLANYYLDGKGCKAGPESDAKALRLLKETATKYENGFVYNNLGWMYKVGRGCRTPDYETALLYFKKAADLECRSAYYHLGNMYEYGLGVEVNLNVAKSFYHRGAELGHGKCMEKISTEFA